MSDRVLIPFGDRVLALPRDVFEVALREGDQLTHEALGAATTNTSKDILPHADAARLLTAVEAAVALSVDASWLLRQAREGRIDHVRLGKFVRFRPSTIIEQCTRRRPVANTAVSAIGCAALKRK